MTDLILPFTSTETTLARVGGKGANLADMAKAGFPVPPGFLITTDAYCQYVETNQLQERILTLARPVRPDDPASLENTSAKIRSLFEEGAFSEDVAKEITLAYEALSTPPDSTAVAVRSSATAEDLPGLAFAGQQDTYLNVVGQVALLDAIKKCWASLWTARAMAYRARNRIPPEDVELAVVVQIMIPSDCSGVLFTANPVTGRRDETVIDASFGLGEAIVSGQVEPDHFVVNPQTWTITERVLGAKAIAIVPRPGGGTVQIAQADERRQALADPQIIELAQTAAQVASHFGSPQDIEWAWAGGRLALLQSRPITSLYPMPRNAHPEEGQRIYFCFNSIQGVPEPFTPLGGASLQFLFSGIAHYLGTSAKPQELAAEAGDRLFVDFTAAARDPTLRKVMLALFERGDPGARQIFLRLIEEGRIATQRALTRRRTMAMLRRIAPLMIRIISGIVAPDKVRPRVLMAGKKLLAEEEQRAGSAVDLRARLALMETRFPLLFQSVLFEFVPALAPAIGAIPVLQRWLVEWLHEKPESAFALMRGLTGNVTTEMDLKLWAAAQAIRADPPSHRALVDPPFPAVLAAYRERKLPVTAQSAIDEFLKLYGMRAIAEIDIGRPRWQEDPTPVLQTLISYLGLQDPNLAPDLVFRRGAEESERLAAEYVARVRQTHRGWLKARLLGGLIRRLRLLGGVREAPKFYMIHVLGWYRALLLESARDLVTKGKLERPEDIFFIPFATLKRFSEGEPIDLKDIVVAERAKYDREYARKQMPRILLSTGEAFYEGVMGPTAGTDLVGDPVSPGIAEGRVHVVLDPQGARLEQGEILVCRATDPGWTPLFLTAGGLVMEIGGMVTHGAVVAREYGIPAIVGVHQATTRLRTGQRVRVDGGRGRLTLLD